MEMNTFKPSEQKENIRAGLFNPKRLQRRVHAVQELSKKVHVLKIFEIWMRLDDADVGKVADTHTNCGDAAQSLQRVGDVEIIINQIVSYSDPCKIVHMAYQSIKIRTAVIILAVIYIYPGAGPDDENCCLTKYQSSAEARHSYTVP